MLKARTRASEKDVIVELKRFCNGVPWAQLSSTRNRLENEALQIVNALIDKLSEIQAAEIQLKTEITSAKAREGRNFGYSNWQSISRKELEEWVGKTKEERTFPRPDQAWKQVIHPKTLNEFGMNANKSSPGGAGGKGASLLDKAGSGEKVLYTRQGLEQHSRHFAANMGATEVVGYREEKKGGEAQGNSDKAVKKRIRERNPFENSEYYPDNRGSYEKWVNREYQENKENYLE